LEEYAKKDKPVKEFLIQANEILASLQIQANEILTSLYASKPDVSNERASIDRLFARSRIDKISEQLKDWKGVIENIEADIIAEDFLKDHEKTSRKKRPLLRKGACEDSNNMRAVKAAYSSTHDDFQGFSLEEDVAKHLSISSDQCEKMYENQEEISEADKQTFRQRYGASNKPIIKSAGATKKHPARVGCQA